MGRARAIQILLVVSGALVACSQLIGLSKLEEGNDPPEAGPDAPNEGASDAEAGIPKEGGLPATCFNGKHDPDLGETDIDCGGSCNKCLQGKACKADKDCHKQCLQLPATTRGETDFVCSAGRCNSIRDCGPGYACRLNHCLALERTPWRRRIHGVRADGADRDRADADQDRTDDTRR